MPVYLIGESNTGPVKIGRSANPKRRLAQLQMTSPYRLHLFCTVTAYGIRNHPWAADIEIGQTDLEPLLHCYFAGQRLTGEWFALGVDDIVQKATRLESHGLFKPGSRDFHERMHLLLNRKRKHCSYILNKFQMEPLNGIRH